jgi:hypothetical protein
MDLRKFLKMGVGMLACCLLPIIVILIVSSLGIASGSKWIAGIVPFLCPIMMVGMMLFMGMGNKGHNKNGHSCCHGEAPDHTEGKDINV